MTHRKCVHIGIVSERLEANLIPALMNKPSVVALASSSAMRANGLASRLENILKGRGIGVETYDELPSGNYARIEDFALSVVGDIQRKHPDKKLVFNATGGNKLMTLAFVRVFSGEGEVIYLDTANGVVEYLPVSSDQDARTEKIKSVLDIPLYLSTQGMTYRRALDDSEDWRGRAADRKQLTKYLAANAVDHGDFLGALNAMVQEVLSSNGKELVKHHASFKTGPGDRWIRVIEEIQKHKLLGWDKRKTVYFSDAEAARFLGGGWLEEYAWHVARDAGPDDVGIGVTGTWDDSRQARNELDTLVVHRNRILVIECKTLKFGNDDSRDVDILYKLDSIADDLRGIFGQKLLLSARRMGGHIRDRARHLGIKLLYANELKNLRRVVVNWMETGELTVE